MEYFFNFDKMGYLKGAKPQGCILCHVGKGSEEVERLVVYENGLLVVSLNLYPYNPGHLIIFPNVPWLDENLSPCKVLESAVGLKRLEIRNWSACKINILDQEDLCAFSKVQTFRNIGKVIATTRDGNCCGFQKRVGKGKITVLGTGLTNVIKEHFSVYTRFFEMDGIKPNASFDEDILAVERFGKDYAYVFLMNYHKTSYQGVLHYADPKTGKTKIFPKKGRLSLKACSSMVIPIYLKSKNMSQI